jgi:uncharacterized membrane protein YfbV (UPF0208 family)
MIRKRIGFALLAASLLPWVGMIALPLLGFPLADVQRSGTAALVLFVTAELLFYAGLFLVGKELYGQYKERVVTWFRRLFLKEQAAMRSPEPLPEPLPWQVPEKVREDLRKDVR